MANTRFSSALHVMVVLSEGAHDTVVSSDVFAERLSTHPVVIRRLISDLKAAGLVDVIRGAGGGIRLARGKAPLSLGDIARAVDFEPAFDVHDLPGVPKDAFDPHVHATLLAAQRDASKALLEYLDGTPLESVVNGSTLRGDLAALVEKGLSDSEIRQAYRVAGGHMVPKADR